MSATSPLTSVPTTNTGHLRSLRQTLVRSGIFIVLALVCLAGVIFSRQFATRDNIDTILTQAVPLMLVALGEAFVIFTGEIDLSVGAVVSLGSVIVGETMGGQDALIVPVALLTLLFGALVGLINGVIVSVIRIPSFLVTLAMVLILTGGDLVWTNAGPTSNITSHFRLLSEGRIGPLPSGIITLAAAITIALWIGDRTALGRAFFAVGSNARAAALAGLHVTRVKVMAFVLSGVFSAMAGVFYTAYVGEGQSFVGQGIELNAIAAVVLGGTSLFGGRGSIAGAVGGVMLLTVLYDLLILAGFGAAHQQVATGLILIIGTLLYVRLRS